MLVVVDDDERTFCCCRHVAYIYDPQTSSATSLVVVPFTQQQCDQPVDCSSRCAAIAVGTLVDERVRMPLVIPNDAGGLMLSGNPYPIHRVKWRSR